MKRKDVEIERLRADVAKKDTEMENLERMLRLKQRRETTAVAHQVAGNHGTCPIGSANTSNTPKLQLPIIPITSQSPFLDPAIAAFFKIGR